MFSGVGKISSETKTNIKKLSLWWSLQEMICMKKMSKNVDFSICGHNFSALLSQFTYFPMFWLMSCQDMDDLQIVIVTVRLTACSISSTENQSGVFKESGQFMEPEFTPRNSVSRFPVILSDIAQKLRSTFATIWVTCDR